MSPETQDERGTSVQIPIPPVKSTIINMPASTTQNNVSVVPQPPPPYTKRTDEEELDESEESSMKMKAIWEMMTFSDR